MKTVKYKNFRKKYYMNNYSSFCIALDKFNAGQLECEPENPEQLYTYYTYIDEFIVWLKNAYKDELYILCNELRDTLGHISEYTPDEDSRLRNLDKAYGHIRRCSIDSLKLLCNGLDKIFDKWIVKHAKYDYSNVDNSFFPEYVEKFYKARNMYIDVQKKENLGSDKENKIIEEYHKVACAYKEVYEMRIQPRAVKIEKTAKRKKLFLAMSTGFIILNIGIEILSKLFF